MAAPWVEAAILERFAGVDVSPEFEGVETSDTVILLDGVSFCKDDVSADAASEPSVFTTTLDLVEPKLVPSAVELPKVLLILSDEGALGSLGPSFVGGGPVGRAVDLISRFTRGGFAGFA